MQKKPPKNYKGGRTKVECPNCGERDTAKMYLGQRASLAECHCGWVFDVETGLGYMKGNPPEMEGA